MTVNTNVNNTKEKIKKWKTPTEESWNQFNQIMERNKNKINNYTQLKESASAFDLRDKFRARSCVKIEQ